MTTARYLRIAWTTWKLMISNVNSFPFTTINKTCNVDTPNWVFVSFSGRY